MEEYVFMDSLLKNALLYSLLPATAILVGGLISTVRVLPPGLVGAIENFAAGAVFSVFAIELLTDILFAHPSAGIIAFTSGIAFIIGVKWLTGKLSLSYDESAKSLTALVCNAGINILIAGLLIGSGFVAGVSEGQLLIAALTPLALATVLTLVAALQFLKIQRETSIFISIILAVLLVLSTATGSFLLSERAGFDLDIVLTFTQAVLLVSALESLANVRDDWNPLWSLSLFFGGVILFMIIGNYLGKRHSNHPGRKEKTQSSNHLNVARKKYGTFT